MISKPDLDGKGLSHPARFPDSIIPTFADILKERGDITTALDPFAGTGKIHKLRDYGFDTLGVELEPEWADLHEGTVVGDARFLDWIDDERIDAVVTSPCYGNRLADSHDAKDSSLRRSYTHDLGRKLSPNNSGAMQWGNKYRDFHLQAWREAVRVLRPGGTFVLNIKDHIRDGKRQYVSGWHVTALALSGVNLLWHQPVDTRGLRVGENAEQRVDGEMIYVFEKSWVNYAGN